MNSKLYSAATQDKMNYITRINADQQLHMIVSFKGRLDQELMERAIHLSILRDPAIGCRFIEINNRPYWQERADIDGLQLCTAFTSNDLEADVMRYVTTPSDPAIDPLVSARIFNGPEDDVLCIKVNHVLADGAGSKEAAYLIADTYSKLEANPAYIPAKSNFKPRDQSAILRRVGLINLIKYRPRTFSLPRPLFELPFGSNQRQGRSFIIRQIKPEIFKALKDFGKAHQATVNDLILTAYYRSLCMEADPPAGAPLPLQVSIDLRHFLPANHEQRICNLSGALFPAISYTPGESFTQTLESVCQKMAHWKSRQPGLTGSIIMELAMLQGFQKARQAIEKMVPSQGNRVNPLLLSNFGLLDNKRLVFGCMRVKDAFELGPVMFKQGLMLTASTYNDRLTLASGFCKENISAEIIEGLIQRVVDELSGLVSETLTVPARSTVFTRPVQ